MTEYLVALTTCPRNHSEELANILVRERVCACVNIVPSVKSIYHWKGKIETDEEALLIMKTTFEGKERLLNSIKENHPYEVPEFVTLPINWGSLDYLDWIRTSIQDQE